MNIYKDYQNYKKENNDLFDIFKHLDLNVFVTIEDTLKVLDYLATKHEDGASLDVDEDEIFDLGFGYISNLVESLSFYCKTCLNLDEKLLKTYDLVLFYFAMFDDLRGFLQSEDLIDNNVEEKLNEFESYIDDILREKKYVSKEDLTKLEMAYSSLIPPNKDFQPTYGVFGLIADELGLY